MDEKHADPQEPAPEGSGGEPRYATVADYLRTIRRHKLLIAVFTILFAVVAAVLSLNAPKKYEATAQVIFQDPLQGLQLLPGNQSVPTESPTTRSAANAQLITRPAVSRKVKKLTKSKLTPDALAATISTQVGVQTNIVNITATTGDPELAAKVANAYANAGRSVGAKQALKTFDSVINQLEDRIKEVQRRKLDPGNEAIQLTPLQSSLAQVRTVREVSEPVQIASRAEIPSGQISPAPKRNTVLGALLGFVFGLIAAFIRDALDRRIHSAHQVSEELGMPVLGRISEDALGHPGLVANGAAPMSESDFEAFRVLRMNLAALGDGRRAKGTVLVTSGLAEEGKSTVSMTLASAAALAGQRVLLVECDLRRPVFAKRLGIDAAPGLSDYLRGEAAPQEILQLVSLSAPASVNSAAGLLRRGKRAGSDSADEPDVAAKMTVIAAGTKGGGPAELLISEAFDTLLDNVSNAYDLVVIDSSPLLSVVDPLEIAPKVDTILTCVRAQQTTSDQIRATRAALENLPSRPMGAVVTGIKSGDPDAYDYYYGY
jgi:capsular polysaccharide biosynthesis protein/Mrp family chromosome partitioning ATPase